MGVSFYHQILRRSSFGSFINIIAFEKKKNSLKAAFYVAISRYFGDFLKRDACQKGLPALY
jgi:hypothetical protein